MLAAKNSKDCSTHRCITHQRQKSLMVKDFSIPVSGIIPNTIEDSDVEGRGPDQVFEPDAT